MTEFRYVKQKGGIGRYAFCSVHSRPTDEAASFVNDQCTWQRVRGTYENAKIHAGYLDWKQSVINGMQCAISRITFASNREIGLLDVDGHIAHSDSTTMFITGLLAIFNEFQIELSKEDQESLDALFQLPREVFGIMSQAPIQIGYYHFPVTDRIIG